MLRRNKSFFSFKLLGPLVLLAFGIFSAALIISVTIGTKYTNDSHLVLLADRFNHMKLSLLAENQPVGDVADYFSSIYLFYGLFASVVLMPFVALFGIDFPQITLGLVSMAVSFWAVHKISEEVGFDQYDSLWLAIFFVFSTVLFGVGIVNITAYQVQALGVALVLVSLAEYFGKRRFWLVGLMVALAGMTRISLYLSVVFYVALWLRKKMSRRQLGYILVPILFSVLMLGVYNQLRFGSFFESGYRFNVTLNDFPMNANVKHGFLSLKHVPANLFALLLKGPEPVLGPGGGFVMIFPYISVDAWGLALWFTSPLMLYLFRLKRKRVDVSALMAVLVLMVPSLLYFGVGYAQFGYRYALDFLPFLFLLLLPVFKCRLGNGAKVLIVVGVLFNSLYLSSLWKIYPHFGVMINEANEVVRGLQ